MNKCNNILNISTFDKTFSMKPFIDLPVFTGDTAFRTMINPDYYQRMERFGEDDLQSKLFDDGVGVIVIDVPFAVLSKQFTALPNWLVVTVSEVVIMINVNFYKFISKEKSLTRFTEPDGETHIDVAESYASVIEQLNQFHGGDFPWPQFLPGAEG